MESVRRRPGTRRRSPPRLVSWRTRPTLDFRGWGTIEIRLGRRATAYRCRAIPTDFGPEHRGFELHKLGPELKPTNVVYHVLVDLARGWHRCDCLGHEAHGHCKHSAALEALCRSARISGPLLSPPP